MLKQLWQVSKLADALNNELDSSLQVQSLANLKQIISELGDKITCKPLHVFYNAILRCKTNLRNDFGTTQNSFKIETAIKVVFGEKGVEIIELCNQKQKVFFVTKFLEDFKLVI